MAEACLQQIAKIERIDRPLVIGSLERHAHPQGALPEDPAALSGRAVEHLKAVGKLDEFWQLQARPTGGIVHENAFDDRGFRVEEYLGDFGNPSLGAEACEQSRMLLHDRTILLTP